MADSIFKQFQDRVASDLDDDPSLYYEPEEAIRRQLKTCVELLDEVNISNRNHHPIPYKVVINYYHQDGFPVSPERVPFSVIDRMQHLAVRENRQTFTVEELGIQLSDYPSDEDYLEDLRPNKI
ncbi:hypothetical protein N7461_002842 [Penicillium sp. DV-2018c]|nr:hypothetical protein N7461_002842 [Penicillium sp. DV-2018c]